MIDFSPRNFRMWSIMGVNPSIWSVAFPEILESNPRAVALTADLCRYSGMARTWAKYPDRFTNVGIAEQNMVGIGAGMALCGDHVYMTTYAPFMTYRCADQFRHFFGNHGLNIKAIGSAAGLNAGLSGSALLAVGDVAFARTVPNLTVFSPADCTEAIKTVLAMGAMRGPAYMRFCASVNVPMVYKQDYEFQVGKARQVREGEKILIIATGMTIVSDACLAAEIVAKETGVSPAVVNFATIKPLDADYLESVASKFDRIYVVEEHSIVGGLGSAVAEYAAECECFPTLVRLGIPEGKLEMGGRPYMLKQCGLSAEQLAQRIIAELKGVKS